MKVEIWADLLCPHCGLAHQQLVDALAAFEHGEEVELIHRSYTILPPTSLGEVVAVPDMLQRRYGMDALAAEAATRPIVEMAAAAGLKDFHVLDNVVGDTAKAHELLAFATEKGANAAAWDRLFRAYFGERRSLFDLDSLVELAVEVGLDGVETLEALRSGRYRHHVQGDVDAARRMGIRAVPFVLIDAAGAGVTFSGAQPAATVLRALREAWYDDARPSAGDRAIDGEHASVCGSDGCTLPRRVG